MPQPIKQRASALPAPTTAADLEDDPKLYATPIARSAYRYDKNNRVQVIRQGNKQLVVHYEKPPRSYTLVLLGIGMGAMLVLIIISNVLISVWNNWQTDAKYGYPRTYQVDMVVGHGDSDLSPSHFIFENLHGAVLIIEICGGDPARIHTYTGPKLVGDGADKIPVTATFNDENGDGKIDLIVLVGNQRIVYINDGTQFKEQQ